MVAITTLPAPRAPRSAPDAPPAPPAPPALRLVATGGRTGTRWPLGAAALVLVLAIAVGYLLSAPAVEPTGGAPVQDTVHVVGSGETMWSIAGEVAPAGEAAAYVERLVEVNGSATVVPGQVLQLPVP